MSAERPPPRLRPEVYQRCPKAPADEIGGSHLSLPGGLCCTRCGVTLAPSTCRDCGKFLSAIRIHNRITRCAKCEAMRRW